MRSHVKEGVDMRSSGMAVLALCLIYVSPAAAGPEGYTFAMGKRVYRKACVACHGISGNGNGPGARPLDPRPRDFTKGLFKFRSTSTGELPTDEDLMRVVAEGVRGTAMPAWERYLTLEERTAVVMYVKSFFPDFSDPDFAPDDFVLELGESPESRAARVEAGAALFRDEKKAGCVKCHGEAGRGDGPEAGTQRDEWGFRLDPADLTNREEYKMGHSAREIYRTLSTGLNGTPMPGYADTLSEEDRWNLAMFAASLVKDRRWYSYLFDTPNWDEPVLR